jgi:hypothetical protein
VAEQETIILGGEAHEIEVRPVTLVGVKEAELKKFHLPLSERSPSRRPF